MAMSIITESVKTMGEIMRRLSLDLAEKRVKRGKEKEFDVNIDLKFDGED
jgi:hypothetical protein